MKQHNLTVNPSSYYATQFREENIRVTPYRAAGKYLLINGELVPADSSCDPAIYHLSEQLEHGVITIDGPIEFAVYLPAKDGHIEARHIEKAKLRLNCIVEMDAAGRSSNDGTEDDGYLAYVEIEDADGEVHLHYFANNMNAEWGAYFKMQPTGSWQFVGLG